MPGKFTCTCCLEQHDGTPTTVIGGMQVCTDCITDSILPIIHGALKYEAQYPPKFGPIELDPVDFADYFDDFRAFLVEWSRKTREYETPYKARVYCSSCEAFLCAKPKDDAKPKIRCGECNTLTCYPCGENITTSAAQHVCPGAPEGQDEKTDNPFEGMQRGKDYQICPNTECAVPIELRDGCNHMICENRRCGTNFCFLCGEQVEPHSGHWNAGGKCSRYNRPDAQNAVFDTDHGDTTARIQAALDEGDVAEARRILFADLEARGVGAGGEGQNDGGENGMQGEIWIGEFLGLPRPAVDALLEAIGREAYDRLIQGPVGMMNNLPALPDLTGMTQAQQLAAEDAMREQLEATPLGALMLEHQREVDHMWDLAAAELHEADDEGFEVPAWLDTAVDLMMALRHNLSLYVNRVDMRLHIAAFEDRHDVLENGAYGVHQAAIFERFPRFYEVLTQYSAVAEIRLLGASSIEAGEDADEVERLEIASLMDAWEMDRLLDPTWAQM